MFCQLCEEACPTNPKSIWLTTKTYEMAAYERNEALYLDIRKLTDWHAAGGDRDFDSCATGRSRRTSNASRSWSRGDPVTGVLLTGAAGTLFVVLAVLALLMA